MAVPFDTAHPRRLEPRRRVRLNNRGGIAIEHGVPADTKLRPTGWTKTVGVGQVLILVEIADEVGRPSQ